MLFPPGPAILIISQGLHDMAFAKLAHTYQLALKSHRHDRRVLKSQVDEMRASADTLRMINQVCAMI